jgi:Domain of unknown function (DUF4390)
MLTAIQSRPALHDPAATLARHAARAVAAFLLLAAIATTARADTVVVRSAELRVDEDAYVLNAEFDLAINSTLEEALQKGVPLYFELEFELVRPRWYWLDEKVLSSTTQYRVSYNALTRQYRIASGLLGQTFEGLDEVERFLSRVNSREVARRDQLAKGARYEAAVRLRLDVNQLPKPFQMSALASREWTLQSDWYRWSYTP